MWHPQLCTIRCPAHLQSQASLVKAIGMALRVHPRVDLLSLQTLYGAPGRGWKQHTAMRKVWQD